jgi:glycine/D-amino acid oxidase-like deaminating enzyme
MLKNCGYVDTNRYISAVRTIIQRQARFIASAIDLNDVVIDGEFIRYGEIEAKGLIVCSGTQENKWFGWLPIRALKGETISIRNNFSEKIVVNRGVYMVPAPDSNSWRVGATYDFNDRIGGATEKGRRELELKTAELFPGPFEVTDHQWGFRPTTPDRRPILGRHPVHKNIFIFNGLGTKGISLAPYFSEVLVHWLENRGDLHKEVDIERFKSLYWASPE